MTGPDRGGAMLLTATGLRKHFSLRREGLWRPRAVVHAVDGVDLSIAAGTTLGLVGESGSGKSTISRLVTRLTDVTDGTIIFDGADITGATGNELRQLRPLIQLVFQDPYASFDPSARVGKSVAEPLRSSPGRAEGPLSARVGELLDQAGLAPALGERYPFELSGGQLQRAGIARALATDPKLVVLDEPVSALDISTQGQIINLLGELQRERDVAFLFVSHDLSVVRHVSDRVAVMYLGRIVEEGPVRAVYERPRHPYTAALLSAVPIPDPAVQRSRQRIQLKGEIPSPTNPPSGCRFRTRCPYVMEICSKQDPLAYRTDDGVSVACHLQTSGPVLAGAPLESLASS